MDQKVSEQPTTPLEEAQQTPAPLAEPIDAGVGSSNPETTVSSTDAAEPSTQAYEVPGPSTQVIGGDLQRVEIFGPAATPSDTTPSGESPAKLIRPFLARSLARLELTLW